MKRVTLLPGLKHLSAKILLATGLGLCVGCISEPVTDIPDALPQADIQSTESDDEEIHIQPQNTVTAFSLVSNGDFAQGMAHWSLSASVPSLSVSVLPGNPDTYVGISKRRAATDGIRQDITASLASAGNGKTFTTAFNIKIPEIAVARAAVQITDSAGKQTILLADYTVLSPGTWTPVSGVGNITWNGTLQSAFVVFEVMQSAERLYPDYELGSITIVSDADGDGVDDLVETAHNSNPFSGDTDSDGLPDNWELHHNLDLSSDDAHADPDLDGFTNYQEYWAATDPHNTASYPGKTANANASDTAQQILRYLALLPSQQTNRVITGQHISESAFSSNEYDAYIAALPQLTGREFGVLMLQYDDMQSRFQIEDTNARALDYWARGGLVQIKWSPSNPWTLKFQGDRNQVDMLGLIDPQNSADPTANSAAQTQFITWLDQVAAGLSQLQDAGVVVLWRPMSEMNGAWFWWGRRTPQQYTSVWRFMFDYFTVQKQLHNLLWVYESDSAAHLMNAADYYYPGDAYVDIMGHNLYNDTWLLSWNADDVYRRYPKVHAIPQAGSATVRDGSWDNRIYLDGLKNRYSRVSYFGAWNSFYKGKTYVVRAIVDNLFTQEMIDEPCIVTLDELPEFN